MFDFEKAMAIVGEQEEKLQFDHFSAADAWDFGSFLVQETRERGIDMSICIRKPNGKTVFQYASDGTNSTNEIWMKRKYNTVNLFEHSSMMVALILQSRGESFETQGLSIKDYVGCGGGFPIRVKGTGIVMILTVSNLPHEMDHAFMVESMSKYLGVEVPALNMEVPMLK